MATSLRELLASTPLSGGNAPYVEALYEQFLADPQSVDPKWRDYFQKLRDGSAGEQIHSAVQAGIAQRATRPRMAAGAAPPSNDAAAKQGAVSRLVQIYANRGHLIANLDPLGMQKRPRPRVLELSYFGLSEADLDTEFLTGSRPSELAPKLKLREIIAQLEHVYCGTIGAEFAHVSDTEERLWLQDQFLLGRLKGKITPDEQKNILWQLSAAEGLERYLHTKYVGQKRFSLEGGDSLIPLMDDLIQRGGEQGIEECVIGMAHRGRLNVLVNLLGKSPSVLFNEFEGKYDTAHMHGSGDVKYHKGFSSDLRTPGGNVHIALAFNPSHLEIVNPVVEGSVRARQDRRGDSLGEQVLPVLIHGDAAFSGQGVVAETFQLSQTRAFYTGGTVHLVINNQIGFTMSDPADSRSTTYCSDIAKMIEAPVFHVNGDDPEAAVAAVRLALRYRQVFHKDVVIDLVGYRRLGHNEADEPSATQPTMYNAIREHPSTRALFARKLISENVLTQADVDKMADDYRGALDEGRNPNRVALGMIGNQYTVDWSRYHQASLNDSVSTGLEEAEVQRLAVLINTVPPAHKLH